MARGRQKQFDETEAVEQAMQLFWSRGYEATGISELLASTGISRQSLYDTFGSKRGLFLRAIEHYRSTQLSQALALLQRDGSPKQNVKDVVAFFEALAADERGRGCFVANALVEVAPHDPELAACLDETLDLLQDAIRSALERAREQGEIPESHSPEALARALTNAMVGMAVTGKLASRRASLKDIFAGTVAMLG